MPKWPTARLAAACLFLSSFPGTAQPNLERQTTPPSEVTERDADTQLKLGWTYWNGNGVPRNTAAAVELFRLAAEQGNAVAQAHLGFIYRNGIGVPQDYVLAHMWSSLSAAQGDQTGAFNRTLAEKQMTLAQIAEAQKLAREWRPTKQPR